MSSRVEKPVIDRPLVIATGNKGKLAEFRNLLKGFQVEIRGLDEVGKIPEVEEDGNTFEENALKKARFTARVLGLPALADDSGLVVDALDGRPGVFSSRYAGEQASDAENNEKLLGELAGIADRRAHFMCVIAVAVPAGPALIYEGVCQGLIAEEADGQNGFGYDPLFFFPRAGKTFASMSPDEKNLVSHRGRAMQELKAEFDKVIIWINQRLAESP